MLIKPIQYTYTANDWCNYYCFCWQAIEQAKQRRTVTSTTVGSGSPAMVDARQRVFSENKLQHHQRASHHHDPLLRPKRFAYSTTKIAQDWADTKTEWGHFCMVNSYHALLVEQRSKVHPIRELWNNGSILKALTCKIGSRQGICKIDSRQHKGSICFICHPSLSALWLGEAWSTDDDGIIAERRLNYESGWMLSITNWQKSQFVPGRFPWISVYLTQIFT